MILIQPDGDWEPPGTGAIRFNAYGLSAAEILATLRRCLIYTAAQRAGLLTVEALIPPQAAVVAPVALVAPATAPLNGHAPQTSNGYGTSNGRSGTSNGHRTAPDDAPAEEKSGKRLGRPPGRRRKTDMDDLVAAEEGRREAERAAWDKS
jgi:hypothetical protein